MHGPAMEALMIGHQRILILADRIASVLGRHVTRNELEQTIYEIMDFHDRILRPHLEEEDHAVLAVLAEHMGGVHIDSIDEARRERAVLENELFRMRQGVETGEPLRPLLEDIEFSMREYVEYAETHLLPWAEVHLDTVLMKEVERRFAEIQHGEPAIEADIEALAGSVEMHR